MLPTSRILGVWSAETLPSGAQRESESCAREDLQPGEFILDFRAPVLPVQDAELPLLAGEDGFFPLVKVTDISEADVSVNRSIYDVCQACPSVIETRLKTGGHRMNATGVPCYRSDCRPTVGRQIPTWSKRCPGKSSSTSTFRAAIIRKGLPSTHCQVDHEGCEIARTVVAWTSHASPMPSGICHRAATRSLGLPVAETTSKNTGSSLM